LLVIGMVLAGALEAMSTGTPVIAWRHGSAPEVIDDGVSGLVVDSIDEAISAMDRIRAMSRAPVRRCFEARFTATRMAKDYVAARERLLSGTVRRKTGTSVAL
jgi:glycosyltransferase involved in cell wall biosynthesis